MERTYIEHQIFEKLNFSEKSKHNFKQNEIKNIYETPSTGKTFQINK
jgi:hypothetical protein